MQSDLIFDIGANNGDDTAHYVSRGFKVVAVEAAPSWAEHLAERFHGEIATGKVELVHAAIARDEGTVVFHVSEANRGVWSSFDPARASRENVNAREVQVPARTLHNLMREFGVPFYMKIDIEGFDRICIDAIDPDNAPEYVSFEASEGEIADLYALHEKGYHRFRLIDQTRFGRVPPPQIHSTGFLWRSGIHALRRTLRRGNPAPPPPVAGAIPGFNVSSSGPMPHEYRAPWDSVDDIALAWLYYVSGSGIARWFDVHATRLAEGENQGRPVGH